MIDCTYNRSNMRREYQAALMMVCTFNLSTAHFVNLKHRYDDLLGTEMGLPSIMTPAGIWPMHIFPKSAHLQTLGLVYVWLPSPKVHAVFEFMIYQLGARDIATHACSRSVEYFLFKKASALLGYVTPARQHPSGHPAGRHPVDTLSLERYSYGRY